MAEPLGCPHPPGFPPNICPSPPPFEAGPFAAWFFFFFSGGLAVIVAAPFAIARIVRWRDWVPLLVIVSGFLASWVEPMLDILGHLRWASDLPMVYTNFGVEIPWLIPFAYAAFFGLESYFIYLVFKQGVTIRQTMLIVFPAAVLTDVVLETIGLNLNVWEYYGFQPFRFLEFPYWWGFVNATGFVAIGALIWYLEPKLHGLRKGWLLLVAPTGMMTGYFVTGWPHFLAHNSTLPEWARLVFGAVTMAGCVLFVRCIAHFVAVPKSQALDWTFWRYLFTKVMLPSQRQRVVENMSKAGNDQQAAAVGEHGHPSGP